MVRLGERSGQAVILIDGQMPLTCRLVAVGLPGPNLRRPEVVVAGARCRCPHGTTPGAALLACLSLAVYFLTACGTGGNLVGEDRVASIKIGQSTKREVHRLLGEPRAVSASNVVGERSETWIYPLAKYAGDPVTGAPPIGVEGAPTSRAQRSTIYVEISFDEKGIVRSLIESRVDAQVEIQPRE